MPKYVLDTNVYVAALRDPAWAAGLEAFYGASLPETYLHASVAQELLAGAIGAERRDALRAGFIAPFERRRRLVTPSYWAWTRSGEILADLVATRVFSAGGFTRPFLNDVLLAASCREEGLTLVTRNVADFERIRRVLAFAFVPPWPSA